MLVYLSPVISFNGERILYNYAENTITATFKGVKDVFDFSGLPDGTLEDINTELEINPIVTAYKKEGILYVELINYIDENASEGDKFPKWYNPLNPPPILMKIGKEG